MSIKSFFSKAWLLYFDGFKNMGKLGKRLWLLITIKLIIMFLILKLIFFPNYLKNNFDNDEERSKHVIENLTKSANK
ncbi:MAG: DUF4492 domain-containing protein [Salinivirgaceae bacterium]|nr:DUF4492 domain-containing protein [Bacteroidales bacterium]